MYKIPLNLIYLKYFCDAVKMNSVSESAKINFVSQSAISQGIHKLEQSLGIELLAHQPNRFKTTPAGMILFEKSRGLFNQLSELESEILDPHGLSGEIDFACSHSFALAVLPKVLKKMKASNSKIKINFHTGHTDKIKELLKKGLIDFGVVIDNEDFSSYHCIELFSGCYQLYQSTKSHFTKEGPFILSEERRETNLLKNAYSKKTKKELPVLMEVSSWEVIASLALEGLGVGFFPDYVAKKSKDLVVLDLGLNEFPYKINAIFLKGTKLSKTIEQFLTFFE